MDISQLVAGMTRSVASGQGPKPRPEQVAPATVQSPPRGSAEQASKAQSVKPEENPVDPKALQDAVERANKAMQQMANNLEFSVDDDTGIRVVKVVDKASGDVIRQMPSEQMLEIAKSIEGMQQSLMLRDKV